MDLSGERRLQDLQMADLGTARREFISTVDKPNRFRNVRLEEIEASRISNRKGSDVQRMAEENKTKLAAWASVHKEIGDTGDLEDLDTLMGGQSHRAQLSAIIRESGGQAYANSTKSDDNFLKTTGRVPQRNPRAGGRGGRGGGIIGTRGRMPSFQDSPGRTTSQGAVTKLGHHVENPRAHNRPLDPAVDPERDYVLKNKSKGAKQPAQRYQVKPSSIKGRRPVLPEQDYESLLADPQGFLAAARSRRESSTASIGPESASVTDPNTHAYDSVHSQSATESSGYNPPTIERSKDISRTSLAHSGSDKVFLSTSKPEPSMPTMEIEAQNMASQTSVTSHLGVQSTVKKQSPWPFEEDQWLQPEREAMRTETKKQNALKGFTSNLPQPNFISSKAAKIEETSTTTRDEPCEDLLLDFRSTPSVTAESSEKFVVSSKKPDTQPPASPAVDDLIDINFQQISQEAISPDEAGSPRLPSQSTISSTDAMAPHNAPKPSKVQINEEAVAGYLKEISMLNDLIANAPLGSGIQDFIKQRRQDIEAKLFLALGTQTVTSEPQPQVQKSRETTEVARASQIQTDARQMVHQPMTPATQQESTEEKHLENIQHSVMTKTSPPLDSPLRQAVTAAPFVPSANAWAYRSPAASSSSNSASPQHSTRIPNVDTHIIGDHLLPGRHGRNDSTSTARSASASAYMSDRPYVTDKSTTFLSSQPNRPIHATRSNTSAGVLSGMKPPVIEGFGGSSLAGRSSGAIPEPSYTKSENQPLSGYQALSATREYPGKASDPVSSPQTTKAIPTFPRIPSSAATRQYAINVPITVSQSQPTRSVSSAPNIPMSAATKQYAVNVPEFQAQRATREMATSPNIPMSAATLQYAINAPKSAFKKPAFPETVTPPSVSRQHSQQSMHAPQSYHSSPGKNQPGTSGDSKHSGTESSRGGLYASKYAVPDPYNPFR